MPIICLMVKENHKMVREMSGKSEGILWGLMAGHPDMTFRFSDVMLLLAVFYWHFTVSLCIRLELWLLLPLLFMKNIFLNCYCSLFLFMSTISIVLWEAMTSYDILCSMQMPDYIVMVMSLPRDQRQCSGDLLLIWNTDGNMTIHASLQTNLYHFGMRLSYVSNMNPFTGNRG